MNMLRCVQVTHWKETEPSPPLARKLQLNAATALVCGSLRLVSTRRRRAPATAP
jgi:hypothetical protein